MAHRPGPMRTFETRIFAPCMFGKFRVAGLAINSPLDAADSTRQRPRDVSNCGVNRRTGDVRVLTNSFGLWYRSTTALPLPTNTPTSDFKFVRQSRTARRVCIANVPDPERHRAQRISNAIPTHKFPTDREGRDHAGSIADKSLLDAIHSRRKIHVAHFFEQKLELSLRRRAHGSIRIQKGEPIKRRA